MSPASPRVLLRLGSHAEKEYFEKLGKFGNGVIFGANLVESTPGATASLIIKLADEHMLGSYLLDPMTYAFGEYYDEEKLEVRNDLAWIKSQQKKDGKFIVDYKKPYKALGGRYADVFQAALESGVAISASNFDTDEKLASCAKQVVRYQMERLREEFAKDAAFEKYVDKIPLPEGPRGGARYLSPL